MITAGDTTIVAGTLAREIYDAIGAQFGAPAPADAASFDDSKRKAAAAFAAGIATRANADLIDANVYTPTHTIVGGTVSALGTLFTHYFFRLKGAKDLVAVFGARNVSTSGSGQGQFRLTLPVASNIGSTREARGVAASEVATWVAGRTAGDATNDACTVTINTTAAASYDTHYAFAYEVKA